MRFSHFVHIIRKKARARGADRRARGVIRRHPEHEGTKHMDKDNTQIADRRQPVEHRGPAVEMTDLCKDFGSFKAVDHLSLTVEQGEIFGLLGPNGSGKTTTINMLSGLSVPTSGTVRVMGYDVREQIREVRQILGAVPQETALYEELSAWTNLDFHADLFGVPRREKKARIMAMLELVQLLDRKDSP